MKQESIFPTINTKESTKNYQKYYIAKSLMQGPEIVLRADRNIFKEVNLESNKDKGPKTDHRGDIVKHSIIGKVDWYNKIKNGKKAQFDETALRSLPTKTQFRLDAESRSIAKSDLRSIKAGSTGKIKREKREIPATKNQLLEEIDKIRMRIEINRDIEDQKNDDLQPTLRRVVTKEERVMAKHMQTERAWSQFILKQAYDLHRDPNASQLIQAEHYRSKLEAASAFESLKSEFERFGPRIWQMTLRQNNNSSTERIKLKDQSEMIIEKEQKFDFVVGSDFPQAFGESSVCGHKASIEYVRKPNLFGDQDTDFSTTQIPFKSFRSDKYLMSKIDGQQDLFSKSFMPSINKTDGYDSLIVVGKNQLEIERQMILNDGGDNTVVYRKNIEKPPEEYTRELVIESNFNGQTKLILPPILKPTKIKRSGSQTEKSVDSRSQDFATEHEIK